MTYNLFVGTLNPTLHLPYGHETWSVFFQQNGQPLISTVVCQRQLRLFIHTASLQMYLHTIRGEWPKPPSAQATLQMYFC